jgi:hypothetical protein
LGSKFFNGVAYLDNKKGSQFFAASFTFSVPQNIECRRHPNEQDNESACNTKEIQFTFAHDTRQGISHSSQTLALIDREKRKYGCCQTRQAPKCEGFQVSEKEAFCPEHGPEDADESKSGTPDRSMSIAKLRTKTLALNESA